MSESIDLEDFFTEENEKNGMWHEPVIDGTPCGLEFLIIGIHTDEAAKNMEFYDGLIDEVQNNKNISEADRDKKLSEIDAARVASSTKGMRAKNGATLRKDGKEVEFSEELVKEFYFNTPIIKMDNIEFALKTSNFMKRKSC